MVDPGTDGGSLRRSGSFVRYRLAGPRDSPLMAFTHGAGMDRRVLDGQVGTVASAGYRGHGAHRRGAAGPRAGGPGSTARSKETA